MTKEALKLALEALEASHLLIHGSETKGGVSDYMDGYYGSCFDFVSNKNQINEAITAIKEALMSVPDGAQPEQEPVAWEQFYPDMGKPQLAPPHPWEKFCDSNCVWTDHHPDCKLAQPEQEPVAWLTEERYAEIHTSKWSPKIKQVFSKDGVLESQTIQYTPQSIPVPYSSQRTWVGLTDEEIDDLSRTMVKGNKSVNWLCQAIEAKLKEKNT